MVDGLQCMTVVALLMATIVSAGWGWASPSKLQPPTINNRYHDRSTEGCVIVSRIHSPCRGACCVGKGTGQNPRAHLRRSRSSRATGGEPLAPPTATTDTPGGPLAPEVPISKRPRRSARVFAQLNLGQHLNPPSPTRVVPDMAEAGQLEALIQPERSGLSHVHASQHHPWYFG